MKSKMKRWYFPFMILVSLLSASSVFAADRCYLDLNCYGLTNLASEPGKETILGVHAYFALTPGQPYPTLMELATRYPDRMKDFDRKCNQARYAKTPLSRDTGTAWNQDTRHTSVRIAQKCMSTSSGPIGSPCSSDLECRDTSPSKCDLSVGMCVRQ